MMETPVDEDVIPLRLRGNRFATISFWCGMSGFAFYSAFICVLPVISVIGFIAGIIGLVIYYKWPDSPDNGLWKSWVGCALCVVTFCVAGVFYARLLNYTHHSAFSSTRTSIIVGVHQYAREHDGRLPGSLDDLRLVIPEDRRYYRQYSFYYLHAKHPLVLNGHLAGKNINDIAYPERTILICVGRHPNTTRCFRVSDIYLTGATPITFLNGDHAAIDQQSIAQHFPAGTRITEDRWFIEPQTNEHATRKHSSRIQPLN